MSNFHIISTQASVRSDQKLTLLTEHFIRDLNKWVGIYFISQNDQGKEAKIKRTNRFFFAEVST